ncbi:hypothetical protein [Lacticaseibacillus absianus]|uniref:hypothetical protein n=1 Tax=Lacticaseibacillus absianus TaxID=2729623 RepID=UPI0015C89739|nr:hypothetical protein [Lacticaseibacillus absianus]
MKRKHMTARGMTILTVLAISLASFAMLIWQVLPQPLNVKVNTVAKQTIIATQTVVDQQRTKEARTAARNAVTPVYSYDNTIAGKQLDKLNRLQKAVTATVAAESAKAQKAADDSDYKAPAQRPCSRHSRQATRPLTTIISTSTRTASTVACSGWTKTRAPRCSRRSPAS